MPRRSTMGRRAAGPALGFLLALVAAAPASAQGIRPDTSRGLKLVQEGKFDEAAEFYRQLTESLPDWPRGWFMYGYCLHGAGRLEEAVAIHRKAAEFPPTRPLATYNLGCASALLGRPDDAFEALFAAADLGGPDPDAWKEDPDLAGLRDDPRWAELMERVRTRSAAPPEKALHFWVGEWDVYTEKGVQAGVSSITLRDNGRVVYEKWTSTRGGGGESFNYFEPVSRVWKQVWVDGDGNVLEMAGTFADGALRFEGTELHRDGRTVMHRTTLTPLDGGRVRQRIENSSDDGATWRVAYSFIYVPRGRPFEAAAADGPPA
ncbi:MAG: tetratricopeptide repeat protein [Planctomycetota bacterium]